jgi:hypothetical protein
LTAGERLFHLEPISGHRDLASAGFDRACSAVQHGDAHDSVGVRAEFVQIKLTHGERMHGQDCEQGEKKTAATEESSSSWTSSQQGPSDLGSADE